MLTEKEQKLLRLALDSAAAPGEIQNCAIKLIESWRRREVRVETLEKEPSQQRAQSDSEAFIMPFGKHKGVEITKVPRSYLSWLLGWMQNLPDKETKFDDLIELISNFLQKHHDRR